MTEPGIAELVASHLRDVPDFPIPGVLFKDITPLLADAAAFAAVTSAMAAAAGDGVDLIAGIEARGFLLAGAIARELDCGMVPVRKAGKLPPPTVKRSYALEYGTAEVEVPVNILDGKRVLLVDDVLATGGTLKAAADLIAQAGGSVSALAVLLELTFLPGRSVVADVAPLTALLQL